MTTVLAHDLLLPGDIREDDMRRHHQAFVSEPSLRGLIVEKMFIYDTVVVPTVDFTILPPIIHWMTPSIFQEAIERGALRFLRYRGSLGYGPVGAGILMFHIRPGPDKVEPWFRTTAHTDVEHAVSLQLQHRLDGPSIEEKRRLAKMTLLSTTETTLPEFASAVRQETYEDILGSKALRNRFGVRDANLERLSGLEDNQIRVFSSIGAPAVKGDDIDICLRLAALNLEAYLGDICGADDMVTDERFSILLDAKAERFNRGNQAPEAFSRVLSVERLPDLATVVSGGQLHLRTAWAIRNSKAGGHFREWFHASGPEDVNRVIKEYVKALRAARPGERWPVKLLRIILTSALGLIPQVGPILGGVATAADSLVIDRVLRGKNPRYLIDKLHHVLFKDGSDS